MTPRHILELVVLMERDLADFYQDVGRIDRLTPFADIFSFMTDHSATHAAQIEKTANTLTWPALDTEPIKALHRRIKSSLREQILDETEETAVLKKLARTEEIIGQLYQSIAEHYRKLSESCTAVAEQFEKLSQEEYGHRDYILDQ